MIQVAKLFVANTVVAKKKKKNKQIMKIYLMEHKKQ